MGFLRNLDFDRTSFWLGFLAGFLFLWLLGRLRPAFGRLVSGVRGWFVAARQRATAGEDVRLRNDALRRAQSMHLAAQLFPLDDILVTPRLIAPPPPVLPGELPPQLEVTDLALPYLPDWPEMAARYRASTITLVEALQNGSSLVIIGHPGSGKTAALAHLASQIARRETLPGGLEASTPLFVHAADFSLPAVNPDAPLEILLSALGQVAASSKKDQLPLFLDAALEEGRLLLILDGLDEMPPTQANLIVDFLDELKDRYPDVRIVASASIEYFDGLARLGCIPLAMASWDHVDRASFIQRWSAAWQAAASPSQTTPASDPTLVNAWLLGDGALTNPLEFTLLTWAAYAGDQLGPRPADAIEAYLRRMVYDKNMQPVTQARPALEQIALQTVLAAQPALTSSEMGVSPARSISVESEAFIESEEPGEGALDLREVLGGIKMVKVGSVLPLLLENGLLTTQVTGRMKLLHPVICGYLAGYALSELLGVDALFTDPEWTEKPGWDTRTQTISFAIARGNPVSKVIEKQLANDQTPLHLQLLSTARWLRHAPADVVWRSLVMRRLAALLQDPSESLSLRSRVLVAMVTSGSQGVQALLHQLSISSFPEQRQLAALGSGLLYNQKIAAEKPIVDSLINDNSELMSDPELNVMRAACLAQVAIGNRLAMEEVADLLLTGNDDQRQAAAEALANDPDEGYATLREGTTIQDVLVRRAVIYGLQRVREPWAVEILEKIQLEEDEWLVKNAATQTLELLEQPDPHLPQPFPPLTETPWLIAFAGEMGIGVSPGKPAVDLLIKALHEGNEDQILAALDYLRLFGDESVIPSLYRLINNSRGDVREAAFNTLWHLAMSGVKLPHPDVVAASPSF